MSLGTPPPQLPAALAWGGAGVPSSAGRFLSLPAPLGSGRPRVKAGCAPGPRVGGPRVGERCLLGAAWPAPSRWGGSQAGEGRGWGWGWRLDGGFWMLAGGGASDSAVSVCPVASVPRSPPPPACKSPFLAVLGTLPPSFQVSAPRLLLLSVSMCVFARPGFLETFGVCVSSLFWVCVPVFPCFSGWGVGLRSWGFPAWEREKARASVSERKGPRERTRGRPRGTCRCGARRREAREGQGFLGGARRAGPRGSEPRPGQEEP